VHALGIPDGTFKSCRRPVFPDRAQTFALAQRQPAEEWAVAEGAFEEIARSSRNSRHRVAERLQRSLDTSRVKRTRQRTDAIGECVGAHGSVAIWEFERIACGFASEEHETCFIVRRVEFALLPAFIFQAGLIRWPPSDAIT
jgi:hypothetical protein